MRALRRFVPVILPLAACTGIQPTMIYAGDQRPIAGTCNPAGRATLTRRGNAIVLAPAEGTLILQGSAQGNAIAAHLTVPGMDHVPYSLSFTGQLDGENINGTLTTPRCRYVLALKLTSD
jgi:hypothetical protein